MHTDKIVTRFAPSPTGFMHIGGVRTALFAYFWARKNKGTFILRIEDTDKEREVPGSIAHIQESLRWFGMEWDYGPEKPGPFGSCVQSERLGSYKEHAQRLVDKGLAYPDPFTAEQVAGFRAQAQAEKRAFLFRDHRPETFEQWDGVKPLRFKVPEIKRYRWMDAVRGELEAGEEALDDFILIKGDGYPTYNFAHIVDDHAMGVTHVFRGDEFISSTPRFLSLYDALEIPYPAFVTLPPILREDRTKKLGKRDGAKDILEYRKEGYLPEAMANFLAFIGWNPGTEQEVFTLDELIREFALERVQKAGGTYNEEKLDWLNREHIKRLDSDTFWAHALPFVPAPVLEADPGRTTLGAIEHLIRERIVTFSNIADLFASGEFDYFFTEPSYDAEKLPWKDDGTEAARGHLERILALLEPLEANEADTEKIKALIWPYAEEKGRGSVLWPLRYSLSGKEKSPDPFSLIAMLGKEKSIRRIEAAIRLLNS